MTTSLDHRHAVEFHWGAGDPWRVATLFVLVLLTLNFLSACATQSPDPGRFPAALPVSGGAITSPMAPGSQDVPVHWDPVDRRLLTERDRNPWQEMALATPLAARPGVARTPPDAAATPGAARSRPWDLWQRLRNRMTFAPLTGPAAVRADQHERWYRANSGHVRRTFVRARLYLHDITEAVEKEGMPSEIALLPAVESAFIADARSHAHAEGLWQFIQPTGRRFELQQHLFVDDRRSVRAATRAALKYLKELQARYNGDYHLALAAYNTGEGNVDAAIRKARARGLAGRYEDLTLHSETQNYVPRLLALTRLVASAVDADDLSAANLPPMADAPYFTAVAVERDIDVTLAAKLAGMSLADFTALNPQHRTPVIVAAPGAELLLPVEREQTFRDAIGNHQGHLASWGAARVQKRQSIGDLAKTHAISPARFREVNDIPIGHAVAPGSVVLVPRRPNASDIDTALFSNASLKTVPIWNRLRLRVQRGDSWASISKRLGFNATELRRWNSTVRLPKPGGAISLRTLRTTDSNS